MKLTESPTWQGMNRIAQLATMCKNGRLNVRRFLQSRGIYFTEVDKPDDLGRIKYVLQCPWNQQHTNAAVFQGPDGKLGFKCFHNSCTDKDWVAFRNFYGGIKYDDYDVSEARVSQTHAQWKGETQGERVPAYTPELLWSHDLYAKNFQTEFLVEGILTAGEQLMVSGVEKVLKTSTMLDLTISLASGTPFLGKFKVPKPCSVLLVSGESGHATIREKMVSVFQAKDLNPALPLPAHWIYTSDIPALGAPGHLATLEQFISQYSLRLIIIDPAYMSLAKGTVRPPNFANLFEVGALLDGYKELGASTGCTVALVHHNRKPGRSMEYQQPAMNDMSMAGFKEWARQWLLLGRREPYQFDGKHQLHLVAGGSAGHGGYWHLDVNEGDLRNPRTIRTWKTEIRSAEEAEADQRDQEARDLSSRVIALLNSSEHPLTINQMVRQSSANPLVLTAAVQGLRDGGQVLQTRWRGHEAFMLNPHDLGFLSMVG